MDYNEIRPHSPIGQKAPVEPANLPGQAQLGRFLGPFGIQVYEGRPEGAAFP